MIIKWIEARLENVHVKCSSVETQSGIYFETNKKSTVFIESNIVGMMEDKRSVHFRDMPDSWLIKCLYQEVARIACEKKMNIDDFKDGNGYPLSEDMQIMSVEI